MLELALAACSESGGAAEARTAILALLGGFVAIMMNDDLAPTARFIVREQMNPTPAFGILFDEPMQPLIELMHQLLQRIAADRLTHDQVRIRTLALFGQVLVFRFARATLMRATGWQSVGAAEISGVRAVVVAHTNAILADLEIGTDS